MNLSINRREFTASLAAIPAALANPAGARAAAPEKIADRTCLFLDDRFIAEQSGFTRTWVKGTPIDIPASDDNKSWESWPHLFGSVFHDPQARVYRMYYEALNPKKSPPFNVLYAESTDGRNWKKPDLGLVEVNGSRANNAVLASHELPNVFLDPRDPDPRGRLKMFGWGKTGHALYRSSDGLRWELVGSNHISPKLRPSNEAGALSDTNIVLWDELGERYLCGYRTYPKYAHGFRDGMRRAVGITASPRLTSGWQPIETVLRCDEADDAAVARKSRGAERDWAELYCLPIFPYGNHYLGMMCLLEYIDGKDTVPGCGDLQLAFSHDARAWHRPSPRGSLIPGADGLLPCYASCNPPLDLGEELLLYYSEADASHPSARPRSRIRAASFRKDGFAFLGTTEDRPATLATPVLEFKGRRLLVNAAVEPGGRVRAALLDGEGNPIAGYGLEDCDVVSGTACTVGWNDERNLSKFAGRPIRLRFEATRGRLYSFRFSG